MSDYASVPAAGTVNGMNRFWRFYGYLLGGLPLCIVAFVIAIAGFSLGLGTLVVWLGLPVLVGTLQAARGLAGVERRATEWATGRALPPHHYREPGGSGIERLFRMLLDPQSWRDLLHAVVAFPVRLVTFVVAVVWTVTGFGSLLYITWGWSLPDDGGLFWLLFGYDLWLGELVLHTLLGVVMLATSPLVISGLVAARAGLARGLLTNRTAALRARATQPDPGGSAVAQAEAHTQTLQHLA